MSPVLVPPSSKVALVSGASSGIGRATADRLHRHGWTVVGASRRGRPPEVEPQASSRQDRSGQLPTRGAWTPLFMDVDQDESVTAGVASVLAERGRLDALVACAGWGLAGAVELTGIEDAKAQLETNFFGAVRLVRAVLPSLRRSGGRIVIVGSIGGIVGLPFQAFYSASKFALEGYAEALGYEVEPFGVRVTVVEPGNVRTEFTDRRRRARPAPPETNVAADAAAPSPTGELTIGDDPYAEAMERAVSVMERDERRGVDPARAARVIEHALVVRHPPRRVSVGKLGERVGVPAKRLLPDRLFSRAAKGSLGL